MLLIFAITITVGTFAVLGIELLKDTAFGKRLATPKLYSALSSTFAFIAMVAMAVGQFADVRSQAISADTPVVVDMTPKPEQVSLPERGRGGELVDGEQNPRMIRLDELESEPEGTPLAAVDPQD